MNQDTHTPTKHMHRHISNAWQHDSSSIACNRCAAHFSPTNRRHHCRLCGRLFCHDCCAKKALIPPSLIVLSPIVPSNVSNMSVGGSGNNVSGESLKGSVQNVSFSPDADPDGLLTLVEATDVKVRSGEQELAEALEESLKMQSDVGGDNEQKEEEEEGEFSTELRADVSFQSEDQGEEQGVGVEVGEKDSLKEQQNSSENSSSGAAISVNDNDKELFAKVNMIQNGLQTDMVYGKTVEQRFKMARDPQRVCTSCHDQLQYLQPELRASNANCVRFNAIDPTDIKRLFNSPLAFTLGHEIRKAAYTLNNLLPMPKRMGLGELPNTNYHFNTFSSAGNECRDTCQMASPNLGDLDGVRIPAQLISKAKGLAIITTVRASAGIGVEFGTGLAVARLSHGCGWSAPNAIGNVGISWGAQIGAQLCDHVFVLMTDEAVDLMFTDKGSFQLGADVAVSVGPIGRAIEADFATALFQKSKNNNSNSTATNANMQYDPSIPYNNQHNPYSNQNFQNNHSHNQHKVQVAGIYTYSLSKGLYIGASFDGKVMQTRHDINEKFYGKQVDPRDLRSGEIPTPPAAQPLYDALKRCAVYADTHSNSYAVPTVHARSNNNNQSNNVRGGASTISSNSLDAEYGEYYSNGFYRDYDGDDFGCSVGNVSCPFPLPMDASRSSSVSGGVGVGQHSSSASAAMMNSNDGRYPANAEWPF